MRFTYSLCVIKQSCSPPELWVTQIIWNVQSLRYATNLVRGLITSDDMKYYGCPISNNRSSLHSLIT
jgi:hypothetical protein